MAPAKQFIALQHPPVYKRSQTYIRRFILPAQSCSLKKCCFATPCKECQIKTNVDASSIKGYSICQGKDDKKNASPQQAPCRLKLSTLNTPCMKAPSLTKDNHHHQTCHISTTRSGAVLTSRDARLWPACTRARTEVQRKGNSEGK